VSASLPRLAARAVKVHSQSLGARRRAGRLAESPRTLVLGPFTSEVGFELLYWIPFARALLRRHGVTADRVVAVSRGGTSAWYEGVADRCIDLLEWIEPDRLDAERIARVRHGGGQKQRRVTDFDRRCLQHVRERIGGDIAVLHPSLMYRRLRPVWMHWRDPALLDRELAFAPIRVQPRPPEGLQPGGYIAVKAYFSSSFPETASNVDALGELVAGLAESSPVVLLPSGGIVDDHADIDLPGVRVLEGVRPETNLGVQTGAVAGARALLATYGGFSYLGPLLGVPTCAFYGQERFNAVHLEALRLAVRRLRQVAGAENPVRYLPLELGNLSVLPALGRQVNGLLTS
jgi:hypothetical protein